MKTILITGANGQLAKCIEDLENKFDQFKFIYTNSSEFDITQKNHTTIFNNNKIDWCINCAAYTAVDLAEKEFKKANEVNILGCKNLAQACKDYRVQLIHISTDFVFDGNASKAYVETDTTNPLGVYGLSKLNGENEIISILENHYIIRTSWLYSEYGNNFLKTMLKLAKDRNEINVVVDQIGTPTYAKDLARLAAKNNKEVMLHLPMQSVEHHEHSPGTLDLHMTRNEFRKQLHKNLNSVPYVRGVNNHMGSLLTRHPGHMTWLMDELSRRGGLYFIDSKTTSKSIADKIAVEYKIPNLSRDFFLDPDHEKNTLRKQFDLFIQKVNKRGYALAIAHPYPDTLKFLKAHLSELKEHGITLIPVSKLVHTANQRNNKRENHHVACTGTACSRL